FEIAPELAFPDGETLREILTSLAVLQPAIW
ncbi:2-amino-4-hydroxy-6-hydroxymethyldihydropteridine diphosphokinase, partial [Escherichia coli]|nr:2-amino-4-hydroxy-6-hydroxymethyldihydropteridine diphosphokinase [Escherichia coli]